MTQTGLPVVEHRFGIMKAILSHQVTLVFGPTGSGKTTQIPQFLLDSEVLSGGMVACTEPKRIAAITAAMYIASERGTKTGEEVGYVVRHEQKMSLRTRLCFATVGVLLREAISDPLLSRYACIIVDEAHERDVFTDFLLGYLKRVCQQRPEFKLVVMSATLRHREFLEYFPGAKLVGVTMRQHPIKILYRPTGARDIITAAAESVVEIHQQTPGGDVLVFVPGERDIRNLISRLEELKLPRLKCLPLFGRMGPELQRLAFQPCPERKVIVATNVAESSVTINNLAFIVDTGLVKEEGYDAIDGIRTLDLRRISRSSAEQRAGRTGRNGPGVCIRLYSEADLNARPKYPEPEIVRQDLTGLLLAMKSLGLGPDFGFLTEPSAEQWEHAESVLREIGAVENDGRLTESGRIMARLPLDARLANLVLQSVEYGCVQEAVTMAAMLTIGRFFVRELYEQEEFRKAKAQFTDPESDFLTLLNIWEEYRTAANPESWCREHFINPGWMRGASDIREHILTCLTRFGIPVTSNRNRDMIDLAILSAFKRNMLRFHRGDRYENRHWTHVKLDHESALGNRLPQFVTCYELRSTGPHIYAYCNHQLRYEWVKEAIPEIHVRKPMALPQGLKPVRLYGELEVTASGRSRTVKVDIDLRRSAATSVQSHDGRNIVLEEARFPVSLLNLSGRAARSLDKAGIATLAELPNSGQEICDLGIKPGVAAEIVRQLGKIGLVRISTPADTVLEPRPVSRQITQTAPTNRLEAAFLDQPIERLHLSGRALMILWGVEVQRIRDLTALTENELVKKIKQYGKSGGRGFDQREVSGADVVHEVKSRLMYFNLRLLKEKDKSRGFNLDNLPEQLPPADPIAEEQAIDLLGLMYPYFKGVRETPPGDDGRIFCRNGIAEVNLGLPGRFCRNMYWYWKMVDDPMLEYEDLFQEGCFGLLWAIEKYDYTRGFAFSTYAVQWITQNIFRAIDNATILPIHVIDGLRKWIGRYYRMTKMLGHEPTREEFAAEMGKSVKWAESIFARMQFWRHFVSLDQPVKNGGGEDEDLTLLGLQAAPEVDLDASIDEQRLRSITEAMLNDSSLQDVDKEILKLRHGLSGQRPHTLEEVGEHFGITRERVRQREEKALEALRTVENWARVREYVPYLPIPTSAPMRFIIDESGDLTKQRASDIAPERAATLTPDQVITAVAGAHGFTSEELLESKRRDDLIVKPRRVAMYLLHAECRRSFAEIGEMFKTTADGVRQTLATSSELQTSAQLIIDAVRTASEGKEVAQSSAEVLSAGPPTVERILDTVADYYGTARGDILGHTRTKKATAARLVLMYLMRRVLKMTFEDIGAVLDRDHSTVISACDKIGNELRKIPESRGVIQSIGIRLGVDLSKGGES